MTMDRRKLEMLMNMLSHTSVIIVKGDVEDTGGFEAELDEDSFDWIQDKLHDAYKSETSPTTTDSEGESQ